MIKDQYNNLNININEISNTAKSWQQAIESLNFLFSSNNSSAFRAQINTVLEVSRSFEKMFAKNDFLDKIGFVSLQSEELCKLVNYRFSLQQNNISRLSDLAIKNTIFNSEVLNKSSLASLQLEEFYRLAKSSLFAEKSNLSELLKSLDISLFSKLQKITEANFDNSSTIDDETIRFVEEQEIVLNDEESQILKDMLETLIEFFPSLKLLVESIKEKKYHKTILAILLISILSYIYILPLFLNTNNCYKINRDNVRIRETPSKENNNNIVCKLSKNISVIKVNSHNGWIKVRFELEEGVEKEGWVYGNMLSEIE